MKKDIYHSYNEIPSLCTQYRESVLLVTLFVHKVQVPWCGRCCWKVDYTCDNGLCFYSNTLHVELKVVCMFYWNIIDFLLTVIQKEVEERS